MIFKKAGLLNINYVTPVKSEVVLKLTYNIFDLLAVENVKTLYCKTTGARSIMAGVAVKTWREIWIRPEVRSTPLERYRPCDHARASPIPAGTLIIAQGGWSHASHPLGWLLR